MCGALMLELVRLQDMVNMYDYMASGSVQHCEQLGCWYDNSIISTDLSDVGPPTMGF